MESWQESLVPERYPTGKVVSRLLLVSNGSRNDFTIHQGVNFVNEFL